MKVSPKSVFITGCNRGIGLELVKQFLSLETPPKNLFATFRKVSDELKDLDAKNPNLHLVQMDVIDHNSYPEVVKKVGDIVGDEGLNLLINNAGLLPTNRDLASVTPEAMRDAFEVNCIAPLFLTRAFLPLLEKAAGQPSSSDRSVHRSAIIQMSTAVASIAENTGGSTYAYRCSKSALNQCMKSMSVDLSNKGILVMAMHPGWVLTDMGGPNAQISTETCVTGMLDTLDQLGDKDHGAFLRYNNTPIQW
eukprot:TRINITY_DN3419_c0_g1_i3.p1 TRINITY_DN3419_c0_g1~~TRINITY_DN3419_c0_g1_i3.p1  ORF type:complete len:250 (-),score=76.87 TRINITY_DN3419_c0_g1_i3:574-1323(-)